MRSLRVAPAVPSRAYFEQRTHIPEALVREYERYFAGCERVLDLGCGPNLLKGRVPGVLGVDVSRHARADLLGDVARLPLRDGSVDGVLAKDILEHLVQPWEAVEEFHRVLATDGRLRVEVPTPHYRQFWDDYTHVRPYAPRAVRELLRDHGFEVTDVRAYCGQGLPGFGVLGAEGAAMRINDALARVRLRKPTNLVGEAVRA